MAGKKPTKSRKAVKPAKSKASPRKPATSPRVKAAAPLRASAPKKVGAVSAPEKPAKASAHASYHPKTEVPQHHDAPPVHASPVPHLIAMTQPWMMLGLQMTLTGLALQARMAQTAMKMAPMPTAMLKGSEAVSAWLAAVRGQDWKPGKG